MVLTKSLLAILSFALCAQAAVVTYPDAPFSVSAATAQKAITCPNGTGKSAGGIVFLVHGTGSTGSESWANGPYGVLLPKAGKGYDICWVDLPGRSLVDAQLSAEYVARGVQYLAPLSKTKKVAIIGHSQGAGLNPQWPLIFFPSIQKLVSNYIALAGDFKGTAEGLLLANPISGATVGSQPSVWQQTVGSKYLAAQNSMLPGGGGKALVPTTSLFTLTDDVIQPENPRSLATSNLPNAAVFALQDLTVCGPTHLADHFSMIVDPAAYGIALQTLEDGSTNIAKFDKAYCTYFKDNVLFNPTGTAALLRSALADGLAFGVEPRTKAEPPLQPYVCSRGYATSCGAAFPPS